MPIYEAEPDFKKWVDRTSDKVPELTSGTLGDRIQKLQPYADPHSQISSTREELAALQGITPDYAHC